MNQAAARVLMATGIVGAAIVGHVVYHNLTATNQHPPAHAQPLPPVSSQTLTGTDLEHAVAGLGPFATLPPATDSRPDTHFPALLLLRQDGSAAASGRWTVPFTTADWQKQPAVQITRQSLQGDYALIQTDQGRDYTVHVGQPFLLEENAYQVYLIDKQGQQWQVSTARAVFLRQSLK